MEILIVMKAISDKTRFRIIRMLLLKSHCVCGISKKLNISESAVSQHIKVLKEANLLTWEKTSYYIHYDVNRELLKELSREINELSKIERIYELQEESSPTCRIRQMEENGYEKNT